MATPNKSPFHKAASLIKTISQPFHAAVENNQCREQPCILTALSVHLSRKFAVSKIVSPPMPMPICSAGILGGRRVISSSGNSTITLSISVFRYFEIIISGDFNFHNSDWLA